MRSPKAMNIQDCISEKPKDIVIKLNEVIMRLEQLSRYLHADVQQVNELVIDLESDRAVITDSDGILAVSVITATELGYLDGVTSNIQDQLDNLDFLSDVVDDTTPQLGGDLSVNGHVIDGYTPSRAVITNSSGALAVSDITSVEIGYLDDCESNIQDQIDALETATPAKTPHWTVSTKLTSSCSSPVIPADFTSGAIGEMYFLSFGSINFPADSTIHVYPMLDAFYHSGLFQMTVESSSEQEVSMDLWSCGGTALQVYVDDSQEFIRSTTKAFTGTPSIVSFDLSTGQNVISIIFDSESGSGGICLTGDFINGTTIKFVS